MYPTLYEQVTSFGKLPYNSWGLMITIAFLVAAAVAHGRARRVGIDPDKMVGMYITAIVFGLAGARLMHFTMATPKAFFADPMVYFRIWEGGFAFYGGFALAALAGIFYSISRKIDPWKMADVVGPVVILGLGFGRIGCFLAGCCHGAPVDLPADATPLLSPDFSGGQLWFIPRAPFLLELTRNGVGHNDKVVYATQIYEVFASWAIFGLGSLAFRFRKFDGMAMGVTVLLYSLWRPFNESLRGDEIRGTDWLGLTSSQLISVFAFIVAVLIFAVQFRKGVKPEHPYAISREDELAGSAPQL